MVNLRRKRVNSHLEKRIRRKGWEAGIIGNTAAEARERQTRNSHVRPCRRNDFGLYCTFEPMAALSLAKEKPVRRLCCLSPHFLLVGLAVLGLAVLLPLTGSL